MELLYCTSLSRKCDYVIDWLVWVSFNKSTCKSNRYLIFFWYNFSPRHDRFIHWKLSTLVQFTLGFSTLSRIQHPVPVYSMLGMSTLGIFYVVIPCSVRFYIRSFYVHWVNQRSVILRSVILRFSHSTVQSFYGSVILRFSHSTVQSFYGSVILRFSHSPLCHSTFSLSTFSLRLAILCSALLRLVILRSVILRSVILRSVGESIMPHMIYFLLSSPAANG